ALHAVEPYGIAGQSALVEIDAVAQTEYGRIDDHHAASGDVLRNGNPQVVEVRHLVGQKPIQLLQQRRVIGGIDVEKHRPRSARLPSPGWYAEASRCGTPRDTQCPVRTWPRAWSSGTRPHLPWLAAKRLCRSCRTELCT